MNLERMRADLEKLDYFELEELSDAMDDCEFGVTEIIRFKDGGTVSGDFLEVLAFELGYDK